jgi:long-subunit acyl-CoA synthetase (AMP-forming)
MNSPLDENCTHLSYLSLSHTLERTVVLTVLSVGGSVGFSRAVQFEPARCICLLNTTQPLTESWQELEPHVLFDDLTVLRPTFLFILPQMAVKLYKRVHSIVSVPARLGEGSVSECMSVSATLYYLQLDR